MPPRASSPTRGTPLTTTKDIAEAALIGESTLYGYFPGKRDILEAILTHEAEGMDALFDAVRQDR